MMASLNYYAELYAAGKNKAHDVVYKRRIKRSMRYWRAMLIRREFERKAKDTKLKQYFFANLVKDDLTGSCDYKTGCEVLWAKNIPSPISFNGTAPFSYVGHSTKDVSFIHTTNTGVLVSSANRFDKWIPRYTYDSNGIKVFTHKPLINHIKIEGYFEDPTLVNNLCADSVSCFKDDEDFPIGAHMIQTIFDGFDRGEFRLITEDEDVLINKE